MDIQLNFINKSNDTDNSSVVVFQKNVATSFDELAVAWQVIQNCGQGDNHPFTYALTIEVAAGDSWGNFTPRLVAKPGELFHVDFSRSGDALAFSGSASASTEIQVRNDLTQGAISAMVYNAGKLAAMRTDIAPGQMAVFQFKPTIWIGVVSQITEGEVMNSAVVSSIDTEISLLGIASADIVMTGGGPGPSATPFVFTLENVVFD